ncbi:hypothetical protein BDN72DRAFT_960792 [Pluteus cervinus]|uniref:Uncharacterized protein n=1 Tax=Pluteus cervinus TaxID=181527 RepID=A0ACD3APV2_9AGAR|nr:hypothetical protein BDN72DRAFT_960792 [Pluteus cervinus]
MHCRLAISILALSAASLVSAAPLVARDHSSIISAGHHVTTQQPEVSQPAAVDLAQAVVAPEAISSAGGSTDTISSIVNNLAHILSLTSSSTSSSIDESAESSSLKPRRRSIKRRHFHP